MAVMDDLGHSGMDVPPPAEDFGRQPPQDAAAEQSVLGGMLLSKDAIADVLERLRPGDFYRPAHQNIYDAILDLYGRGEPADAVTVAAESGPAATSGAVSCAVPSRAEVLNPDAGVHAFDDVDHLGDVEVCGRAEVGVGETGVHGEAGLEQGDGGADAVLHGGVEVLIHAGGDQELRGPCHGAGQGAEVPDGLVLRDDVEPELGPQ